MTYSIVFYGILQTMSFKKIKHCLVFRAISIILLHAFFVSNLAFAIEIPANNTLAATSQLWQQEFKEKAIAQQTAEMREKYQRLGISEYTTRKDIAEFRAAAGLPVMQEDDIAKAPDSQPVTPEEDAAERAANKKEEDNAISAKGAIPFRGVIFDLDGVVVDTNPLLLESWNKLFEEIGRPKIDVKIYNEKVSGRSGRDIIKDLLGIEDEKEIARLRKRRNNLYEQLVLLGYLYLTQRSKGLNR